MAGAVAIVSIVAASPSSGKSEQGAHCYGGKRHYMQL